MIKVINSIDAYHNDYVADAVARLQSSGFSVTKIERVQKMKFAIFGEDVTHIHYEEKYGPAR